MGDLYRITSPYDENTLRKMGIIADLKAGYDSTVFELSSL